jgi:enamine deaminase RidA (YjgF/YER057c/UK114 family)
MTSHAIDDALNRLGIVLPTPAAPVANYLPFTIVGDMVFISGQLPVQADATMIKGRLGADLTLADGQAAARACAINILAQAKAAAGGHVARLGRCVKLTGFVAATPEFHDHPQVINAASDLMVAVLGEAGRHARAAVGVPSLPFGAAVEIEAVFTLQREV